VFFDTVAECRDHREKFSNDELIFKKIFFRRESALEFRELLIEDREKKRDRAGGSACENIFLRAARSNFELNQEYATRGSRRVPRDGPTWRIIRWRFAALSKSEREIVRSLAKHQ
jgi:hypothetical protein